MIFIALGANLPGPSGPPLESLRAACRMMPKAGITVERPSRLYRSAPVPPSGQPDFLNAVVGARTAEPPEAVLSHLLEIEAALGRTRRERWEARVIDLDLIDYAGQVISEPGLDLPHPRLAGRRFVLEPLRDVAPDWRHPATGAGIGALLADLGEDQPCEPIRDRWLDTH